MAAVKLKQKKNSTPSNKNQNEGGNEKSYIRWRFYTVYGLIILAVVALLSKVAYIQFFDSERLIKEANDRSIRTQKLTFTRGRILDRDGRLLSVSDSRYSITIDPKLYFDTKLQRSRSRWRALAMEVNGSASKIRSHLNTFLQSKEKYDPRAILNPNDEKYWTLLARVSGIDYNLLIEKVKNNPSSTFVKRDQQAAEEAKLRMETLAKSLGKNYGRLMTKMYKNSRRRFLYLDRHRSEELGKYAKELKIDALVLKTEYLRVYPLAEAAAQLVGFTKDDDQSGTEGLERSFNSLLVGKNGKKIIRKDFSGNMIEQIQDEKQYDPQDVMLSIDEELQLMVYREVKKAYKENKAKSATAVLVDVRTGEVLSMATAPSFNPNNRSDYQPGLAKNNAIKDTFEPGSTVKPFVVLTALQNGVTYRDEVINTRPFIVNGHTIKDVGRGHDKLSLTEILKHSSNIGVSRLALRMPPAVLMGTYNKIGFGTDTGLGLGEVKRTNGDRNRWADIERATVAYGYGLEVTPLQLARAYATLGSFGIYRPLSITKVDPPVIGKRVLPEKITHDVVEMMESVAQKGGGGWRAAVNGYRVAVKTGTVHKLDKKTKQYVDKYIAYTAGVAPASDPRFALVVLVNEPNRKNKDGSRVYYGGAVAAQVFSKIMGYALKEENVKPDNLQINKKEK